MKNRNWFWGLFFIVAGVLVIVNRLGYFTNINLFSLILTLFLIPILVKSILRLHFPGVLFPVAFLCMIYAKPLGMEALVPWPVLFAAFFGSIGLSILFHKPRHFFHHRFSEERHERFEEIIDGPDDEVVNCYVSFGSSIKYVNSENLKKATIGASFGALKVYFDNTKISSEGATINIDASFAAIELYIPKNWNTLNQLSVSLSGVEEKNRKEGVSGPTVRLVGEVSFSGIEIIYT